MTGVGGESELMCTSMTAHQLRAHAAQILRLSGGCDDIQPITNAAVITLQKNSPAADSPGSGDQYSNVGDHPSHDSLQLAATPANSGGNNKRRRRPAGTPDPDAEVVALSPKTLMESDRFICEICNQGFQRDQNLQMHRRHHKVPWKLVKNTSSTRLATHKKRVYVCPELTCLHHEPQHALGDLVGIKKHFRRKHCSKEQWICDRCSKGYAVQSDYKAHLKTCGTRGHCCDCGRVFSRVESFIEHQDSCSAAPKVQKGTNMRSGSGKKLSITLQQRRSTLMTTRARNGVSSTDITSFSRESNDTSIVPFANSASIESDKTAAARGSADSSTFMKEQVMTRTTNSSCRFDQSSNHNITRSSNVIPTWVLERRSELQQLLPLPGIDQVQSRLQESYNNADVTLASSTVEQAGHDMQLQALASHNFSARYSTKNSAICPEVISNFTRDCRSLVRPASSDSCCVVVDVPSLQLTIGHFSESPRDPQMISTSDRRSKYVIIDAAGSRDTKPNPKADVDQTRSLHGVAMSDYQLQTVQEANPDAEAAASGDHHAALIMQRSASNKGIGEDLALMSTFPAITASLPPRQTAQDSGPAAGVPDHNSGPDVIDKHIAKCADHQQQPVISQSELPIVARTSRIEGALTRQKELAATTCAEANKAREQASTEMKSALSDLAAARRTKEQARLESAEAENEIARAELIKHQAREQLQQASAEKAFAQHARDVAKRQKDIAETELADAKRMRERAQAEIDKSRLLQLKARSSRDDQCSPGAVNAITRLMSSPRDHHNFQNSTEICQVCKSESAVGSDLTLGLHQTNRGNTPIRPSSAVNASRPVPPDHKIRVTQTASHEISSTSAAGLVSYPKRGESIKVRLEDATCSDKSQLVLEQSHGIN